MVALSGKIQQSLCQADVNTLKRDLVDYMKKIGYPLGKSGGRAAARTAVSAIPSAA